MNVIDIILAALLLFGFVRGFLKGFFVEIASLIALVAGVYGAMHFSYFLGDWLHEKVSWSAKYISLTAFAGTFIGIVVVISLAGKILTKIADFAMLGIINKILGGVFGALKIAVIVSVLLTFFSRINNTIPFVEKETIEKSVLFKPVKDIIPILFPNFGEEADDIIEKEIRKTI